MIMTPPKSPNAAIIDTMNAHDEQEDGFDQDLDLDFDWDSPLLKNITIRTKEDFDRIVQKGLDDIKAGRVHTLEETITYMKNL